MQVLRTRVSSEVAGRIAASLVALSFAACSSDDFGTVGSSLPLDVSQDSLLVEAPLIDILDVRSVVPQLDQTPQSREFLYLGNRPLGGWRATPLIRFDLAAGISDSLLTGPEAIERVYLDLRMRGLDADKGILRTVRVHDLADTLRTSDAAAESVGSLLGDVLSTKDFEESSSLFEIDLPIAEVWEWLQAGGHRGVALYDLTEHADVPGSLYGSNFVGLESSEFAGSNPELKIRIAADAEGVTHAFTPVLDFSIVERDAPPHDALVLGSYTPSRFWMRFALDSGEIPGNATINRALLELMVDEVGTIAGSNRVGGAGNNVGSNRTTLAYEALEGDLSVGTLGTGDAILRSASSVRYVDTDSIMVQTVTIDVTDFVQRAVNLVVPAEAGILVRFSDGEVRLFEVATFHGPSAAEALRPRLSVTFTPPADTWR